ncbi:MAG: hypothetical protein L0206_21810, partial [Actinobacteria bacterium]|nr:hypothetical protein [Actinomycetota bacterium]
MSTTEVLGEGGIELGGSAGVAFTPGIVGVLSDIVVEWDLDNDGDFDEAVEDVTGFLVDAETVTGRDFPSQLTGQSGPGQLRMRLRNDDDRFSFFNTASPLNVAPNSLRVGRKIRIRAVVDHALELPATAGDHATTPDHADLDVTGDLTIGVEFDPVDAASTIQTLVSKWNGAIGNERSAMLQINANGFPRLVHTPDGTSGSQIITTSGARIPRYHRQALWVSIDVDDGGGNRVVRFYTADRFEDTPELLDEVTVSGTTSIHSGAASLQISGWEPAPNEPFLGHVYVAEWRAGLIASTDTRALADFRSLELGTTGFTDAFGQVWTVNGDAAVVAAPPDDPPKLLARDRFLGSGALGSDELGNVWTSQTVG